MEESGLAPGCLRLEITEKAIMSHADMVLEAMQRLRSIGVQIYIDDFGTGYSSLSYLQQFSCDSLKIDRSFVRDLATNHNDRRLVEAIVLMAHGLGLVVVAEGVESRAQDTLLGILNCDLVQGNYYSEPITALDIIRLFNARSAAKREPVYST